MGEYFLIDKRGVPQSLSDVLKVKDLIDSGMSITDACKSANISRSTYYKYQDMIKRVSNSPNKKVALLIKSLNRSGVLSSILNFVAGENINVLSINQGLPIHDIAHISLILDISSTLISVDDIVSAIKNVLYVKKVEVLSKD